MIFSQMVNLNKLKYKMQINVWLNTWTLNASCCTMIPLPQGFKDRQDPNQKESKNNKTGAAAIIIIVIINNQQYKILSL